MNRFLIVLTALFLTLPAALLLVFEFEPIWPNLAASYICTAPLFVYTHLLHRRLKAQDAALAETHRKVHELHALHVEGRVPLQKRIVRPSSGDAPAT